MLVQLIFILVGLFLLVKGADWLVGGASTLAKKYNISDLAIGLTIVAFGTSAPELVVNIFASVQNHQDIVFGNVIGSNNFNLFAILGITGLISPLVVQSSTVWKEIPISLLAVVFLYLFANAIYVEMPVLTRAEGFILLFLFSMFLFYVYKQLKSDVSTDTEVTEKKKFSLIRTVGLIIIGLAALILGGRFIVVNSVKLATTLGMSEKIIGLTIVAAGTSLPELATSVVAALKKNVDIAVGNIIGSNIFNIFFILAASAIIKPINYDISFNQEVYFLIVGTVFLFLAMFTGTKKKLDRWEAAILLFAYLIYVTYLIYKEV